MTVRILVGDVRERLAELPDNSVQCVVTSPPYFGLRDYGTAQWDGGDPLCDHKQGRPGAGRADGIVDERSQRNRDGVGAWGRDCGKCGAVRIDSQIGLEPTLAAYIATMVDVFRDVRRVLRPDGTCWLNIGDSYASSGGVHVSGSYDGGVGRKMNGVARYQHGDGLKPKDLMMVPARLAIALCDDGWYLRAENVWAKPNPMPESVTDRTTRSHEFVYMFSKSPRYYYDKDAVAESSIGVNGGGFSRSYAEAQPAHGAMTLQRPTDNGTRNLRSVWTITPENFPDAHFATFPTEIPRRCIKAGTSEKGACSACGSPWVRVVERESIELRPNSSSNRGQSLSLSGTNGQVAQRGSMSVSTQTTGWEPSCSCHKKTDHPQAARRPAVEATGGITPSIPETYPVVPCLVLDPFFGAGTTGLVSDELGRDCIGIELNREYSEMARNRIYGAAPMFAAVEVA